MCVPQRLVWAASNKDRAAVLEVSRALGFLTGDENAERNAAHVDAAHVAHGQDQSVRQHLHEVPPHAAADRGLFAA